MLSRNNKGGDIEQTRLPFTFEDKELLTRPREAEG
jgi:hypothetical protein